jgi:tetratricopeptide (TPR) repeat protein
MVFLVALAMYGYSNPGDDGKVPVTTKSEEAKRDFLLGRSQLDHNDVHEARANFDKAIAADTGFALAYLYRSTCAATITEMERFAAKAGLHAEQVSEGERLIIRATEAQLTGDQGKAKELYDKLLAAYPRDERVHEYLAVFCANQLDHAGAVEHFKAAGVLNPDYAPVYNSLGYEYRSLGKYPEAEQAFKKYVALVPGDANPYDSYAELLMKEGKFDQSIENYNLALSKDPNFFSSKLGIAFDHLYMGKADQAAGELRAMIASARDESERRQARSGLVILYIDGGNTVMALQLIDSGVAESKKRNELRDEVQQLDMKGSVLEEAGRYAEAKEMYDREMAMIASSSLSPEIKEQYDDGKENSAAIFALETNDLTGARSHAAAYEKLVTNKPDAWRLRSLHQLYGRIALEAKEYEKAIEELQKSNLENAYNLYRIALAYRGKGDTAKAKEYCARAAHFYSLPDLGYSLIRLKAEKLLSMMNG